MSTDGVQVATQGWTKVRQQTTVGEALAVACCDRAVIAVTSDPMTLEAAFRDAWDSGSWSSRFPKISAAFTSSDLIHILRKSSRRAGPIMADWEVGTECEPRLLHDWDLLDFAEHLEETTGIPYPEWLQLADAFLTALGEDNVRRSG